ncbi:MAG: aminodeoxychorismate lyase [Gammaproteobacteria bacterium]|nr:aminodeoxychorismate lyase [Gammaproteobacteria bacterium]
MGEWYRNGEPVGEISIASRGLHYGDGLFETIAIRAGSARLWEYHAERLTQGCERLGLKAPHTDQLLQQVTDAIRQSDVPEAYCIAKIIVVAAPGLRGYGRPRPIETETYVGAFLTQPVALDKYHKGLDTLLCETRLACGSPFAGLKTLNRLEQVLARSEVLEARLFEGLTMDADDRLICGTMSNVFLVAENKISTPQLNRCGVAGVMRRLVVDVLADTDCKVQEIDINREQLASADEVFLSNSQFGLLPVKSCADWCWDVGPVTQEVMRSLAEQGIRECRL